MALIDDLQVQVKDTFKYQWSEREGYVVPEPESLKLGNDAIHLKEATVLYADLDGSTSLVETKSWPFAAEIYKSFLFCATKLIKDEGGSITSYDGDRVMGIFLGGSQSSTAVRCALKITYAVREIINPAIKVQYPSADYKVRHVIGIDHSAIRAARTGVRGDNDIVWVGRAANYAAKLTALNSEYPVWITKQVYDRLEQASKFGGADKQNMWREWKWTQMNNILVYSSTWQWRP